MLCKTNFYSQSLMRNVDVNVVLPIDGFHLSKTKSASNRPVYKTLYLLHGIMGDCHDWLMYSDIVRLSQQYQIAVVMPSGDNSFYVNQGSRVEALAGDLSGSLEGSLEGNLASLTDGLAKYSDFIGAELPSMMEQTYPLLSDRAGRFIGGLSMGGYGAIVNGLKFSDRFSHIIGLSSALMLADIYQTKAPVYQRHLTKLQTQAYYSHIFGDIERLKGSDKDYEHLAKRVYQQGVNEKSFNEQGINETTVNEKDKQVANQQTNTPKIFLACGDEDYFVEANRDFAGLLQGLNCSLQYVESAGEHNWTYWSEMIQQVFAWLSASDKQASWTK